MPEVRVDQVLHLRDCGFSKRQIRELLGCTVRQLRRALVGQKSVLKVRHIPLEAERLHADRYYVTPLSYAVPPSDDHTEAHGPVRQIMRDGKPVNEIVWEPKKGD